jgi:hypothetical protein
MVKPSCQIAGVYIGGQVRKGYDAKTILQYGNGYDKDTKNEYPQVRFEEKMTC